MIRQNVNENDKRVIKTKRNILNAFTELLATYDINEITITDIARKADVNRKTVYNYYNGVYDVLEAVEKECIKNYENVVEDIPSNPTLDDIEKGFNYLAKAIESDIDFYTRLSNIKNNTAIVNKIYGSVVERIKVDLLSNVQKDKADIVANFITSGMISAFMCWFKTEDRLDLEKFSKDVIDTIIHGITPYFD